MKHLQQDVAEVSGITLYMQPVQDLTIEDHVSRNQYQFIMEDADPQLLENGVDALLKRLRHSPALKDTASDIQNKGLQAYLEIDRDTAGRLGITTAAIDNALYNAFGQRLISNIFTQSNQYRVVLEVAPEFSQGLDALNGIYVTSINSDGTSGGQVPLNTVAKISARETPLLINHFGQFPAANISFNLGADASPQRCS